MKGLIEFLYLIIAAGIVYAIWLGYRKVHLAYREWKYKKVIAVLKRYGYRYAGTNQGKGKNLIYSKAITKDVMNSQLLRYNLGMINIEQDFTILDYAVVLEFPEWEERYSGVVVEHGGLRLLHFYTLMIQEEKTAHLPLTSYWNDDLAGEPLAPMDLDSEDLIESILSSSEEDAIRIFYDNELKFWQSK
jgi:hypothetical protein